MKNKKAQILSIFLSACILGTSAPVSAADLSSELFSADDITDTEAPADTSQDSQQQQMKLLLPTAQTPWKNQPMTCSSHPMILHLLKTEQMILPQIALILSVPAKSMIFPIPREMMIFLPERQNKLWPVSWMIHWKLRWPEKEALLLKQISRYLLPSLPHVRYIKAATWRARIILTGLHLWNLILLQVRMVILCAFRAEPLMARS